MSELEDILNYLETTSLEPHDDYVSEFSYKNQKTLWKYIKDLRLKNQELKKQLENCYCNRTDCSSRIKDSKKYDSLVQKVESQQKEFIDWLENEIENCKYGEENYADGDDMTYHNENELRKEILSKYKEIIGEKDE